MHAHTADRFGNLRYRKAARNFNPVVAASGRVTVVEAEIITDEPLDPDWVHTPGVYVTRLVQAAPRVKQVEQRTTRPRSSDAIS